MLESDGKGHSKDNGRPASNNGRERSLAPESYEFILRTETMTRALKGAYEAVSSKAENREDMLATWRSCFEHVYGNLFAIFLRPVRLAGSPANLFLKPLEPVTLGSLTDFCLGWYWLTAEAYAGYITVFVNALRAPPPESALEEKDRAGGAGGPTSMLQFWQNMTDDVILTNIDIIDRSIAHVAEHQFIWPPQIFSSVRKVLAAYPEQRRLAQQYEALFRDTWERACTEFFDKVREKRPMMEFGDFFEAYVSVFSKHFDKLFGSSEFIKAQGQWISAFSDWNAAMRQYMESQLDLLPFSPLATRRDAESLAERLHSYKKRNDLLERRVRALETRLKLPGESPLNSPSSVPRPLPEPHAITAAAASLRLAKRITGTRVGAKKPVAVP